MKVEVVVLGTRPNEIYSFCGRKAALNRAYTYAWSQFVPNTSTNTRGHEAVLHHHLG